jgi:hypothetical protein
MITPEVLEALRNGKEVQVAKLDGWETLQFAEAYVYRIKVAGQISPGFQIFQGELLNLLTDRIWRIKPVTMNFLGAVARMKQGVRMRREGWGHSRMKPMTAFATGSICHCSPEAEDPDLKLEDYEANDWYEVSGE